MYVSTINAALPVLGRLCPQDNEVNGKCLPCAMQNPFLHVLDSAWKAKNGSQRNPKHQYDASLLRLVTLAY